MLRTLVSDEMTVVPKFIQQRFLRSYRLKGKVNTFYTWSLIKVLPCNTVKRLTIIKN